MLLPQRESSVHWSTLLNLIISRYFHDTFTTCVLWHDRFEFAPRLSTTTEPRQFITIKPGNLEEDLSSDVYNFPALAAQFKADNVTYDGLMLKLMISIQQSHCESFVVFQADIPLFVNAFYNASTFSIWRSQRNKFLFLYSKDLQEASEPSYFSHYLFIDQPSILVIEMESLNSSAFELKTNKFVGSVQEHPEQLYFLDRYFALNQSFELHASLYFDKTTNLQGREIVMGFFDYRPFTVLDENTFPKVRDMAVDNGNGSFHIDGSEVRFLLIFCELRNCTVQVDTTEKDEWGIMHPNGSGNGLVGLIADRRSHMAVGALYHWYGIYSYLDLTTFLGRSGITCLVPAPKRITSWYLPLRPFQFTLWMAVLSCLCLEVIALLLSRRLESLPNTNGRTHHTWLRSFEFGCATTLQLFVSQASHYVVNSHALRMVLFSCYVVDIIVTSVYGGGLASVLTLPTLEEAADSRERLSSHNLIWTAKSEVFVRSLANVEDNPLVTNLLLHYRVYSTEQIQEMAKTENMGFVLERSVFGHFGNAEYVTRESLNHLKLMIDDIYFEYTVAFVPRLWAFLAKYNELIFACHSAGLVKFWEWHISADYLNDQIQRQIESSKFIHVEHGAVRLDIDNFAGLAAFWVIGIVLSVLVYMGELMYASRYQLEGKICKQWMKIMRLLGK